MFGLEISGWGQGIPLQGHKGEDNFTQLMVLLGAKDENI